MMGKMMKLTAKYQGTATKAIRATAKIKVQCAADPSLKHDYDQDEVIGAEPTRHHYTFGKPEDAVSGGFYVRVGTEIPAFIELHAPVMSVTLNDLGLILEVPKPQ